MKRLKDTIRKCGAVGYKPDADLKRHALKSMLTKSEWNDSTEKASLKTGNKVSELTYDKILVHVDTKVDATEDYEITRPVDGPSSSSPPKRNHEFGAAADCSQRPKGRDKGRRGKKSNRKEKSFQGERGEESQSGAAASGATSSSQTWPCPNCGHMKHLDPIGKKGCPAANVRCSFEGCGMVRHYMKCCPKNPKRKQQQAKAAGVKTVHLPFEDEGGNIRIVPEEGCIDKLIGRTLLPCAKKKLHLKGEDSSDDDSNSSWVRLRDIHGRWFRAPIDQMGSVSMLHLAQNKEAIAASYVCPPVSTFLLSESALSGQSDLSEENKAHLLHVLHSCLGHATGQCLEATLKEKGVGVPYSVEECRKVRDTCKAYQEVNFRRRKLKRRGFAAGTRKRVSKPREEPPVDGGKEGERESKGPEGSFNADIYHDLKDMKRKGIRGVRYMSVIVDFHTRRKSFWCCRSKDRALAHLVA
uniref:Uncharacterized protein n=1 Tax=Chromera velia CCMP2878 TaxID=1169474 RepID=A0A0G4HDC5_9ALVE|eukprot:Cvel_26325.t1-p1 / transcript=Cvel_26325.t1 / gene=Cvel_26325 / organism=Chromera_velia_CCMP2878 / gene_product=hypothetical protein / transcript_product=hypothetical protein / location=Cvel_scaffold3113:4979-6816(-) / protein_length=468 / sequence_SO=supercontig / SO=protein_coding / is_pseudo=false